MFEKYKTFFGAAYAVLFIEVPSFQRKRLISFMTSLLLHETCTVGRKERRKGQRRNIRRSGRDVMTAVLVNQRKRQGGNVYDRKEGVIVVILRKKGAADIKGTRRTSVVTQKPGDITEIRGSPSENWIKVVVWEEGRRNVIRRGRESHRDPDITDMTVLVISTCT